MHGCEEFTPSERQTTVRETTDAQRLSERVGEREEDLLVQPERKTHGNPGP